MKTIAHESLWLALLAIAFAACFFVGCGGCGSRTVIVPGDAPVQLAEPATVYVYVTDPTSGAKIKSANRVTIPEGYVAFPPALLRVPATSPAIHAPVPADAHTSMVGR